MPKLHHLKKCTVCGKEKAAHSLDKNRVYWCPDNVSVRASFKVEKRFPRLISFPEPGEYKLTIFPNGDNEYEHISSGTGTNVVVRDRSFEKYDAETIA